MQKLVIKLQELVGMCEHKNEELDKKSKHLEEIKEAQAAKELDLGARESRIATRENEVVRHQNITDAIKKIDEDRRKLGEDKEAFENARNAFTQYETTTRATLAEAERKITSGWKEINDKAAKVEEEINRRVNEFIQTRLKKTE